MSAKALARTVCEGRMITAVTPAREVTGYLCGMDDFTWMIIRSDCSRVLVHKSGTVIELSDKPTYDAEAEKSALEKVIAPFRDYLVRANLIPAHIVKEAI